MDKTSVVRLMEDGRALTSEEVRRCLEEVDAFWLYPGKPDRDIPHALLTSGKHSDGYVNVGGAMKEHEALRWTFAVSIFFTLVGANCGIPHHYTGVVGADTSSTDLAGDLATIFDIPHIRMVKTEDVQGKRQVWHPDNLPLLNSDQIIHIEELLTTSSSALQVRAGIRKAHPDLHVPFAPWVPVVVERSDPDNRVLRVENSVVLPLLQLSIRNYDPGPQTCPYCAVGSEAIKPKEGDNWAKLTGKAI